MENTITKPSGVKRKINWQGPLLIIGILLLAALAVWMIASQVLGDSAKAQQVAALTAFEEETGIRLLRVAMTAAGGMIDLQYQVIDPDKSLIVHDDDAPPTLIDEASGLLVATPWHDHSFRELHTAVTYHELIMNGGGLLERGDRVTLTLGDAKLEGLIVE